MKYQSVRVGFTLVELLVVIGIIALLIGILLPVLSSARAASQNVACLSNIRQLSTTVMLYVNDSDGTLPYAWGPDGELVNRTLRVFMDDDSRRGGLTRTYECPSVLVPLGQEFFSTYAVNLGTFIFSPPSVVPPRPAEKIVNVQRSTEVLMFGDANQTKAFPPGSGQPSGGSEEFLWFTDRTEPATDEGAPVEFVYQPDEEEEIDRDQTLPTVHNIDEVGRPGALRYRHGTNVDQENGSANVAFHDGHAASFDVGELTQKNIAVTY